MLKSGLVSITFRSLTPSEIITAAHAAELSGVEWGGDLHVPHGDLDTAAAVGETTRTAGLECAAYGSYYRFRDVLAGEGPGFSSVVATARALGAPLIRIWAGETGSAACPPEVRGEIVAAAREAGDAAAARGIRVAFEFHGGTLTDTAESARALIEEINHPNVGTLWQPPVGMDPETCVAGLQTVLPWLANVHCFNWGPGGRSDAHPLADAAETWKRYLEQLPQTQEDRWVLLEFVPGDDPAVLSKEAQTLNRILAQL